jgi:HAD superfamily hydrolase (TIGR01458 family)
VSGALIDVDGTLLNGDVAIPGAAETLRMLRARGVALRLTTNTTRRPRAAIAEALGRAGIEATADEIVIPASLARRRILDSGSPRAALLIPEASKIDLAGVEQVTSSPDWVVVGDLGRGFTFDRLTEAFRWLGGGSGRGAGLIALHKNRYWHAGEDGFVLDAGPFVAALEYAAGVTAEVVGKPAPAFFELALRELGVPVSRVLCVGDSLENDCIGARRVGCRTVLVRTGVFTREALSRSEIRPDFVIESIADLAHA